MVNEVLAHLRCHNLDADTAEADVAGEDKVADEPGAESGKVFLDCTLGTAGHTIAMLQADPTCRVIAFDRDIDSMEFAQRRLQEAQVAERATLVRGDFRNAPELLKPFFDNSKVETEIFSGDGRTLDRVEPITHLDGALIDAGMSLYQVTWAERGLSFRSNAPLDMRYDRTQEISAFDLVNRLSVTDLEDLIFKFTDERWARRIALTIAEHRQHHIINTTAELASLIEAAIPAGVRRQSRVHPATKTFAALRLAVNDEYWALDQGAWALSSLLANTARLVILTYSSHEDRTVKRTFRSLAGRSNDDAKHKVNRPNRKRSSDALSLNHRSPGSTRSPLTFSLSLPSEQITSREVDVYGNVLEKAGHRYTEYARGFGETWGMKIVTAKPVVPTPQEIAANPLARSCKLRAVEKFTMNPNKTTNQ